MNTIRITSALAALALVGGCAADRPAIENAVHLQRAPDGTPDLIFSAQRRDGGPWRKEGLMVCFGPDGEVESVATYHDDEMDGPAWTYDIHGRVASSGSYAHNRQIGPWRIYKDGTSIVIDGQTHEPIPQPVP